MGEKITYKRLLEIRRTNALKWKNAAKQEPNNKPETSNDEPCVQPTKAPSRRKKMVVKEDSEVTE